MAALAVALMATFAVGFVNPVPVEAGGTTTYRVIIGGVDYGCAVYSQDAGGTHGVRLYLWSRGAEFGKTWDGAYAIGSWIVKNPSWKGDRSDISVTVEIWYHCQWGRTYPTHIEYDYAGLHWWERQLYGR
ncbi:hypothetical protein KKG24_02730 [Patescibacteria group bacterium]|nr:hypothetical protein [Patescibacteria group bacterium]